MDSEQTENVLGETVFIYDALPGGGDANTPDIMYSRRSKTIMANKVWLQLDLAIKEVTVAHEIGHRNLDHGLTASYSGQRCIDEELDADAYACRLLTTGRVLDVFDELIKIFEKENCALWKPAVEELYFRRRWILNNYDYI